MLTGYTGATRGLVDFVAVPCLGIQPSLTVVLLCVLLGVDLTVDAIVPACPLVALALALSRAGPATIEATIYCLILPLQILYLPLPLPSLPLSSSLFHHKTPSLFHNTKTLGLEGRFFTASTHIHQGLVHQRSLALLFLSPLLFNHLFCPNSSHQRKKIDSLSSFDTNTASALNKSPR